MTCEHPRGKLLGQAYRVRRDGAIIFRRRECPSCGRVFSTEEREVRTAAKGHPLSLADLKDPIA